MRPTRAHDARRFENAEDASTPRCHRSFLLRPDDLEDDDDQQHDYEHPDHETEHHSTTHPGWTHPRSS